MISIRSAVLADMPAVARVHIRCFPSYFSTKFGPSLLQRYYGAFWEEDHLFVVAEDEEQIIGFCMGNRADSRAKDRFVRKNLVRLAMRCLGLVLRGDRDILRKAWSYLKSRVLTGPARSEAGEKESAGEVGDLLSICVDETYRGSDTAVRLVEAFEAQLRQAGICSYALSVKTENNRAQVFYEKLGMHRQDAEAEPRLLVYVKVLGEERAS